MSILLLLTAAGFLCAQEGPSALVKAMITPAGGVQRVTVNVPGPVGPNDDLGFWSPTRKLQIVVVTPSGKRINEDSASKEGVDWRQNMQTVDSAEADAPLSISVRFPAQPVAGNYVFEVTPLELELPVEVTAAFRPEVKASYAPGPASGASVIMLGPASAAPSAQLEWKLDADEQEATVDVLVSDPNAKVRLLMPGNLAVTQFNAADYGMRWRVTDNPSTLDPPAGMLSLSGFYIPGPGWHHVVNLQRAPRGVYRVVVDAEKSTELRTAFLPVGRLIQTAFDSVDRLAKPRDAEVKFSAKPLPGTVHTGDNTLLQVMFDGEPIGRPVHFEAVFEYRSGGGPPHVRRTPLYMGWALDDTFRTYFQPEREGELRVKLSATGRTITGFPFSVQTEIPPVVVRPVTARLMGIWEQPVDSDGNGKFDRMDVHVELEVARPAEVDLGLTLMTRTRHPAKGAAVKSLGAGRQRVTVQFPAASILALPGDGPYIIDEIQIKLKLQDGSSDDVQTTGYRIGTQAYRREQWEATK